MVDISNKKFLTGEEIKELGFEGFMPEEKSFMIDFIKVNFNDDLEKYRGLDRFFRIMPQNLSESERDKLPQLLEICPETKLYDRVTQVMESYSTKEEYLNGEKWIEGVISGINPEWSDAQKIAWIDNQVGKKISYAPDFNTEVEKREDERTLWRIMNTGYGVCNGIAQVEQYILDKIGIETELISSGRHAFLKVPDIEIPRNDGTTVRGATIVDPTWNLTAQRFGAYPGNLFVSYEEIRKHDINSKGVDIGSHRNDEQLSDCTVNIEENELRKLLLSIGLAKEDLTMPIGDMSDRSEEIAKQNGTLEEKIEKQFELLKEMHPDFYKAPNSSMSICTDILLNHPEMKMDKLVTDRVYAKNDEDRQAVMYMYYKKDNQEGFYIVDSQEGKFSKIDKEQFIEQYECYDYDLKKSEGTRPWEDKAKETVKDLNQSSGKILPADKEEKDDGEER